MTNPTISKWTALPAGTRVRTRRDVNRLAEITPGNWDLYDFIPAGTDAVVSGNSSGANGVTHNLIVDGNRPFYGLPASDLDVIR